MRVITGTARGKRLETLPGDDITRPTAERVKEALFSAIQFDIEGRRVLDLFAGSGQLGIEALSRGASGAVFVDRNASAAAVVQKNLRAAGFFPQSQVLCTDALGYLAHPKDRFGLVFLDPPYASDCLLPALTAVVPYLETGAIVMAECDAKTALPEQIGTLVLEKQYRYGRVSLYKYRMEE